MSKAYDICENSYYLDVVDYEINHKKIEYWNISETISQLAYLTHSYFRYYGKFPSKVGKNIIEGLISSNEIDNKDYIFDNYAGSGTTLVEAKIAGYNSLGIDINPFAVLACKVKTKNLDNSELKCQWNRISTLIEEYIILSKTNSINSIEDKSLLKKIEERKRNIYIEFKDVSKWFYEDDINELIIIKSVLLEQKPDSYREFFTLGFFAVLRRISKAYDGEVRPHINKSKKRRDVKSAYFKKIHEMISLMGEWNKVTDKNVSSNAFLVSNNDGASITHILDKYESKTKKSLGLVVSHPPYLNCFDYIPVYKLLFNWAFDFEEIYDNSTYEDIKKLEVRSYPVNNDRMLDNYFHHHKEAYKIIYNRLRKGGYCCIVIGDCTVRKKLLSVHKIFIQLMESIGFKLEKVVYRSTHYGLGKYAYSHRADYHSENGGKKDAIIFFKK